MFIKEYDKNGKYIGLAVYADSSKGGSVKSLAPDLSVHPELIMKGKTLIGTCGGCDDDEDCMLQDLLFTVGKTNFNKFGCNDWKEKS